MATVADYVGKNCPYCGAIDSIETDEARGEAACTECATVVAMGLEESMATRWEKEATFADVDREERRDGDDFASGSGNGVGRAKAKNAGLTREEAAAAAAGLIRHPHGSPSSSSSSFFDTAAYEKTRLHERLSRPLERLFRLSHRHDESILQEAVALAKQFVGRRRERSVRVEHQTEVAAACLMLASEHHGQPIPLGEMRVLDPSLKDVESRRHEIINEGNLQAAVATFEPKNVANLIHYYLQLLQLPLVRYEQPCLALFRAIGVCEAKSTPAAADLAQLVEAEKAVLAVLLARTEPKLRWSNKPPPPSDPAAEPPVATLYSSFASNAHLNPQRVQRIMRVGEKALPALVEEFERLMMLPEFATTAVRKMGEAVDVPVVKTETSATPAPVAGVKRSRSRSPTPPSAPH